MIVDIGLNFENWKTLNYTQKYDCLVVAMTKALKSISNINTHDLIEAVGLSMKEHKSELKIIAFKKDVKSYSVEVYFQIKPNGMESLAWLQYTNKKTETTEVFNLINLDKTDDIYFICGRISVKNKTITVYPKKTETSVLYLKNYATPFIIKLQT